MYHWSLAATAAAIAALHALKEALDYQCLHKQRYHWDI